MESQHKCNDCQESIRVTQNKNELKYWFPFDSTRLLSWIFMTWFNINEYDSQQQITRKLANTSRTMICGVWEKRQTYSYRFMNWSGCDGREHFLATSSSSFLYRRSATPCKRERFPGYRLVGKKQVPDSFQCKSIILPPLCWFIGLFRVDVQDIPRQWCLLWDWIWAILSRISKPVHPQFEI